jgi:hypothetical protein
MRRRRKSWVFTTALSLALLGIGVIAASASASFHLTKIREVSAGTGSDDSYVEVQMYAPGQNFLGNGAKLAVCDSSCSPVPAEFTGFSNVANGNSQDTVVFGDTGVGSKDFNVNLNLQDDEAGGAACYVSEPGFSDCVSWGNFTGNTVLTTNYDASAEPGSPAPALSSGMALRRSISPGCPTALEASDDTNNSAADFAVTTPNPRPNSVAPTEATCSSGPPTSNPTASPPAKKKKKCKKRKRSSTTPGTGSGTANPPAYAAKKKCKKKKKRK